MFEVDFHSHVLPGIDDGARSIHDSCSMLKSLFTQGVSVVFGTPHFRMHRNNIREFCQQRRASYEAISNVIGSEASRHVKIGAEVAIEYGISEMGDPSALAYQGTNFILMELPYRPFDRWMLDEITNISYNYFLTPVIAHVDRYYGIYSYDDYCELFSLPDVIFQVNNEAFLSKKSRKIVDMLIDDDLPFVLGSDSHNMTDRAPNFDVSYPYLKKYYPHPRVEQFKNLVLV